jgi:hypothetical protein
VQRGEQAAAAAGQGDFYGRGEVEEQGILCLAVDGFIDMTASAD